MYHSTDNGSTWMIDSLPFTGANLSDFCFINPRHGWAINDTVAVPGPWDEVVKAYVYIYDAADAGVAASHSVPPAFQIYPNPSSRSVTITSSELSGSAEISVVDALGRTVSRATMKGKILDIPTIGWADGYYQIVLRTPDSHVRSQGFLKISN